MKVLILFVGLLVLFTNYRRRMLLSSSSVWVACYVLIFVLYPIYGSSMIVHNADTIDLYAVIGIFMFALGYFMANGIGKNPVSVKKALFKQYKPRFSFALYGFVFFAILTVYAFITKYGINAISLILSGNTTSKVLVNQFNGEVGGLYDISIQLLIPFILSLWVSANTKKEKIIRILCAIIFIILQLLFNFTRIFLITFIAVVFFYELRHYNVKRQAITMGGGMIILIVLMVSMNFIRTFGLGDTPDYDSYVSLEYLFESTDFGFSYYWFDRLLDYGYPGITPLAWLKFLFVFIPRTVWPGKPEQISMQILKQVDPTMQSTGYSTAGNSVLGEGYAIFGDLGIILFPLMWGYICMIIDKKYYYNLRAGADNSVSMILYYLFSIFIILSAQRGDWSQYLTTFIYWWTIPLFLISSKKRKSTKYLEMEGNVSFQKGLER